MTRSTKRWIAVSALFLAALPICATAGCGKKEEPASVTPPAPPQMTTPEGMTKSAMPGGGPPHKGQ